MTNLERAARHLSDALLLVRTALKELPCEDRCDCAVHFPLSYEVLEPLGRAAFEAQLWANRGSVE